jgi:hypothetical protein
VEVGMRDRGERVRRKREIRGIREGEGAVGKGNEGTEKG